MNTLSEDETKIIYVLDDQFNDEILKFDEFDDVLDHIYESEIIGYYQAMNYLMENDVSLRLSLALAYDSNYQIESTNLSCETLATLHHQHMLHQSIKEVIE
tara:strand:+ start:390 stop:692 length:303 start_codon:yes stop_codon:yes gene_type:complete